jgi:hypothetical protein
MGLIEKIFAIAMLPLSILIILEWTGIFSLKIAYGTFLIGAVITLAYQIINLVMLRIQNGHLSPMQIASFVVFILPAVAYIVTLSGIAIEILPIPLVLGVMMLVEGLYGLQ